MCVAPAGPFSIVLTGKALTFPAMPNPLFVTAYPKIHPITAACEKTVPIRVPTTLA